MGEAPGHRGCRLTGIPFISGETINDEKHRLFKKTERKINLPWGPCDSLTASTVRETLFEYDIPVPILWNAFPFHRHERKIQNSNRKPNREELEEGKQYIMDIYEIFKPNKICSVGRVSESVLKQLFPVKEISYIRHPSRGGQKKFAAGMLETLVGSLKWATPYRWINIGREAPSLVGGAEAGND